MKRSISLPILGLIIFLFACKKEDEHIPQSISKNEVIEGHLFQDCEGNFPYQDFEMLFYKKHSGSFTTAPYEDYLGKTKTDSNGYFYFDPNTCYNGMTIQIVAKDTNQHHLFSHSCYGGEYLKADFSEEQKGKHIVKIRTNKTFTNQDTLIMWTSGELSPVIELAGPFEDNQTAETIWISGIPSDGLYAIGVKHNKMFWWGIGMEESTNLSYEMEDHFIRDVRHKRCGYGDTILVDLRNK